ncbi:unnamed protein product [Paramecium octaurelia]|uniref:Uncharacterized protein n=1 Tax=Paramecium octaurelia TaxID=43137 RepID=A0A8S1WJT0_PAROT|nr:unnamed protein product [Paramecium octaurelia]
MGYLPNSWFLDCLTNSSDPQNNQLCLLLQIDEHTRTAIVQNHFELSNIIRLSILFQILNRN